MMLHNDKELFEQTVLLVARDTNINPAIIEKDYFVTLFLKEMVSRQPNLVFKGGTSLSKCYKLIKRFSEDIDLNIETDGNPTEGQKKKLKANILSIIDGFGFQLTNAENVRSRRSYNKYVIDYPSAFAENYLKEHLIVETSVFIKAYPCEVKKASSLIYDYLAENKHEDLIKEYGLEPFDVNVQTASRTLIDKLYALGDYYLADAVKEHSRHIYDIYKLIEVVPLDEYIKKLVKEVYEDRKDVVSCRSAKEGINMNKLLQEIIDKNIYQSDYENVTSKMLFEEVNYGTAINALQYIVDKKIF